MVKRIIMNGKAGEPMKKKVIDYSEIHSDELISRIREYETKYSSYDKFSENIDCGESPIEELDIEDDWRLLIEERRQRVLEGKIKIHLNSKPVTFGELYKSQESLYEILKNLEKQGLIKEYSA